MKYGWIQDREDNRDLKYKIPMIKMLRPIPQMVDLSVNGPAIKNQGDRGACVGFGCNYAAEMAFVLKGFIDGSPLFTYRNAVYLGGNDIEDDPGSQIRDGIKALAKWGLCPENLYPYSKKLSDEPDESCYREASKTRIIRYEKIKSNYVRNIQQSIADGFPVVLGIWMYSSSLSNKVYTSGIIPTPNKNAEEFIGGHCIVLCSYNMATGMFKFPNSWGEGWGNKGYGYISFNYIGDDSLCQDRWVVKSITT